MTTYDAIKLDTSNLPGIVTAKKIISFYPYYGSKSSKIAPEGQEITYLKELTFLGDASINNIAGKESIREIAFVADAALLSVAPYFHFGGLTLGSKFSFVLTTPEFYLEDIVEVAGATFSAVCPNLKFGYNTLLSNGIYINAGLSLTGKLTYLSDSQFIIFGVPDTGKDILISIATTSAEAVVVKSIYVYSGISTVINTIPSFEAISIAIAGNLSVELPMLTVSGYGGATGAVTLPLIECEGTGRVGILGNFAELLPKIACSGSGITSVHGNFQETLSLLTCVGTGILGASGNSDITLPVIEVEATGYTEGSGDAAITLPMIECYGTGIAGERFDDVILRHSRY